VFFYLYLFYFRTLVGVLVCFREGGSWGGLGYDGGSLFSGGWRGGCWIWLLLFFLVGLGCAVFICLVFSDWGGGAWVGGGAVVGGVGWWVGWALFERGEGGGLLAGFSCFVWGGGLVLGGGVGGVVGWALVLVLGGLGG